MTVATRAFASDNNAGVHPAVLAALAAANDGHAPAYGADPWTARAERALCAAFDADAEVLLCFGGTGANVFALGAALRAHEAVLCAQTAHINNDECGAPERFTGAKLIALPDRFGKITPDAIAEQLGPTRGVHHVVPRVVSITQPTEWGVPYTLDEMRAIADFAHDHGLLLHVDGARLANAAAALDVSLAQLGPLSGIDVLSLGGTKNGLMGAEAVLVFNRDALPHAAYARKQAMQLASKMRFLAAQFLAWLEDDLWLELARHANAMTARLVDALNAHPDVAFATPARCNMLFPMLPAAALAALHEQFYFYTWDEQRSIARWVTAFDTQPADVDDLAAATLAAVNASG